MYCTNCGQSNEDGALFCTNCGAPLPKAGEQPPLKREIPDDQPYTEEHPLSYTGQMKVPSYPHEEPEPQPESDGKKKKLIPILIGAAAAVVLAALLICFLLSRSWKGTVNRYMRSVKNLDFVSMIKLAPKAYLEYILDDDDTTLEEVKDELRETIEEIEEAFDEDIGEEYDITLKQFMRGVKYKIRSVKDFTGKELRELNEDFERWYDADPDYIKAGKHVKLKVYVTLDDETESETVELDLIKTDGKWCIDPDSDGVMDFLDDYLW